MSRVLKFRAWDKGDISGQGVMSQNVRHDCDADSIMQFTGLTDKNGVDIYYQDVIKVGENIYRVEWVDGFLQPCVFTQEQWGWFLDGNNHFKYCHQEDNIRDYFLCQLESYEIEVIGNIFENKELLA